MNQEIIWTAAEAAEATGGSASGDWQANGLSIDSRSLSPGEIFVALQGPNFDGHDYIAAAFEKGAVAAIAHRQPKGTAAEGPLLLVDDTLAALWKLGAAARARSNARFIGVTGSVGKTGTKEALRHCLSAQAPTYANVGSLNNHWGVPLSLARMPRDTHYGVFELGMNNPGEIRELVSLVRPQVAVITNVEAAHIGNFDSVGAIADAKAEIFESLEPGGSAILNRDHPMFHHLRDKAVTAGVTRIVGFGRHHEAEIRLTERRLEATHSDVTVSIDGKPVSYRISLPGSHWVTNSLAVLAAVHEIGADVVRAAETLSSLPAIKGRGERHEIAIPGGTFLLIDDSYNANPTSMKAAFEVLGQAEPGAGGRRIAILGDMLELGERGNALHRTLAGPLSASGVDLVFTCGPQMQHLASVLPKSLTAGHTKDSLSLVQLACEAIIPGDVVLVKGSLGSKMRLIVDALLNLDGAMPRAANGD